MFGTERGLSARSELRAEINELISQLEAKNPTPNPTEVPAAVCGAGGIEPGAGCVWDERGLIRDAVVTGAGGCVRALQAINQLDGTWKLIYTSNSVLLALLALGKLPLVAIGDLTQRIDSTTFTVENKVRPHPHALALARGRTPLGGTGPPHHHGQRTRALVHSGPSACVRTCGRVWRCRWPWRARCPRRS